MNIVQKSLITLDFNIAFPQLHRPVAAAFDLRSGQLDACFKLFNDRIIVKSLSVVGKNRVVGCSSGHKLFSISAEELFGIFGEVFSFGRI